MSVSETQNDTAVDVKAQLAAKRAGIHEMAVAQLVVAVTAEAEASAKFTPMYRDVAPLIVNLRETFLPVGTEAGWEPVRKATRAPQYAIAVNAIYDDAVAKALPIKSQPEPPEAEADDAKREKYQKALASWHNSTEPIRVRRAEVRAILPLRLQHHIETEMAKRYGPKAAPVVAEAEAEATGATAPREATNTAEHRVFSAAGAGAEFTPEADIADASLRLLRVDVAILHAVEAAKETGLPGQTRIYALHQQTVRTSMAVCEAILRGMPKREADALKAEAKAEAEAIMEAEAKAKAEADAKADADATEAEAEAK